jgi:2-oxoisovalerate dehydrogenase E1 component alpha subunit
VEAHTNADDASRYRSAGEVDGWLARDPVARLRQHLCDRGLLDQAVIATVDAEAEAQAAALRQRMNTDTRPDPDDLFRYVYAEPTPELRRQQRELDAELGRASRQG